LTTPLKIFCPHALAKRKNKMKQMSKNRLEAFSDGVIAIILTIMVLEIKVPNGGNLSSLIPIIPVFLSYMLSFIYVGIYWNNHHHLFQVVHKINGYVLLANLHLLFWLSLIPFTTGWMGQNNFSTTPTALYGGVLLMSAIAYTVLQYIIIHCEGNDSCIKVAIGNDFKGKISLLLYIVSIPMAYFNALIAQSIFIIVALMWLIPDRRIEKLNVH
jgi:uncharacterized membrane protein